MKTFLDNIKKHDEQFNEEDYEDILKQYSSWSDKRYNTILRLKHLAQNLDNLKFGTNVTKNVSGGVSIAASVLGIISIPLPVVLPAAIAMGAASAATSIASASTIHHIEKTSKKNFKEICNSDGESSKDLRKSLEKVEKTRSANVKSETGKCDATDGGTITSTGLATTDTVFAAPNILQGVMKLVNVASQPLAVAAKVACPALTGVGMGIDVALMGTAIYDMVENNSKHEQAKEIEKYIKDLEMEMELRAWQIAPIKYLLVKQHLQKAIHDIQL